jgi:hypothetical protein
MLFFSFRRRAVWMKGRLVPEERDGALTAGGYQRSAAAY